MAIRVAVLKEKASGEKRVAIVSALTIRLEKLGAALGDPSDPKIIPVPQSSNGAACQVKSAIRETVKLVAKAEEVGLPVPRRGAFVQPIFAEVGEDKPAHGAVVAKRISADMDFVCHPTKVEADLPFGSIRRSGYGRELLGLGLKEFVNHKLIDVLDIDAHF